MGTRSKSSSGERIVQSALEAARIEGAERESGRVNPLSPSGRGGRAAASL